MLWIGCALLAAGALLFSAPEPAGREGSVRKTDAEWRKQLTPEQYRVTRQGGTERAGTGEYLHHKAEGVYGCVCCELPLFSSAAKYDSRCGWPSFYEPIAPDNVEESADGAREVHCARCDAHLGHVFADGPPPTGLRY